MENFGFEDCGPKLQAALIKHCGSDEAAKREVAMFNSSFKPPAALSQIYERLLQKAHNLLFVAMAARHERGKELLALVGDAMVEQEVLSEAVLVIPFILNDWLKRMEIFLSTC